MADLAFDVASRLNRGRMAVRRQGANWETTCPAHDDANPSLSVMSRGGKLLYKCHAHCGFDQIAAAMRGMGIDPFTGGPAGATATFEAPRREPSVSKEEREQALFLEQHAYEPYEHERWWEDPRAARPPGKGFSGTTYAYRDLAGVPTMMVHRFDKVDPAAPGKQKRMLPVSPWVQLADRRLVLPSRTSPQPRLPYGAETLSLPGTVWLVEGEKCRDALYALLGGTFPVLSFYGSSPGGSDVRALEGRASVTIPDYDKPGEKYAAELRAMLGAGNVRMRSTWRGGPSSRPPKGWDIADDILGKARPGKAEPGPMTPAYFVQHVVGQAASEADPAVAAALARAAAELRMRVRPSMAA